MLYYIINTETNTCVGSGTLDECMEFVQYNAFHGITGYSVVNAATGEEIA